jgi:hypothetical protein
MGAPNGNGLVVLQGDQLRAILREEFANAIAQMAPRETTPVLLDRRGLAAALGVGVDTVDRLRREGAPELTIGDAPRFELDRVLEWVRGRR